MNQKKVKEENDQLIGDKLLSEWDMEWQTLPRGFSQSYPQLRYLAGLYRALRNGETKVIGCAAGKGPGKLTKRLSDFRRPSDNGRAHTIGDYIHRNIDVLELQVLVVGVDRKKLRNREGALQGNDRSS